MGHGPAPQISRKGARNGAGRAVSRSKTSRKGSGAARCKTCYTCVAATATCCNSLQPAATRCNLLQLVATCCNPLQPVATCCNSLEHAAICCNLFATRCCPLQDMLHCVAACCSLLQPVANCTVATPPVPSLLLHCPCRPTRTSLLQQTLQHSAARLHHAAACCNGVHRGCNAMHHVRLVPIRVLTLPCRRGTDSTQYGPTCAAAAACAWPPAATCRASAIPAAVRTVLFRLTVLPCGPLAAACRAKAVPRHTLPVPTVLPCGPRM
jgi:hypothetical protein